MGRRPSRHARPRPSSGRLLFIAAVVVIALGFSWLTFAVSAANAFRQVRPDLANSIMPLDARAKAGLAERASVRSIRDRIARAETIRLAREALARDATLASAWRTLGFGLEADGRRAQAGRLITFAERLSRRDLPTQLWLIERSVARNDIAGALAHYDIALRTSQAAADVLFPVLVQATANDGIVTPLAGLLRTDPPWRRAFLMKLSEGAPSSPNVARLLEETGRGRPVEDADILANLIHRMTSEHDFASGWRVYRAWRQSDPRLTLRNSGFEGQNPAPPFDWRLENGANIQAEQGLVDGSGNGPVLTVRVSSGIVGVAAQQAMMLPPGTYRLAALSGPLPDTDPAGLFWRVICGGRDGAVLAEVRQTSTGTPALPAGTFRVPAGNCGAQWLQIGVLPRGDSTATGAWVDSVRVAPAAPAG